MSTKAQINLLPWSCTAEPSQPSATQPSPKRADTIHLLDMVSLDTQADGSCYLTNNHRLQVLQPLVMSAKAQINSLPWSCTAEPSQPSATQPSPKHADTIHLLDMVSVDTNRRCLEALKNTKT